MTPRLGIDVGGTSIRLRMYPGPGRLEALTEVAGGEAIAARVIDLARQVLGDSAPAEGIDVGIPGQVDPGRGTVRYAVNLGIDGTPFPLAATISRGLGLPVTVENDVRAAAYGAFHHLRVSHADLRSLVYLSLGTGVSAGVVLDGRIHRGSRGLAGEIGHAPLGDPSSPCACGLSGCLEATAGGKAIGEWVEGGALSIFDGSRHADAQRVASAVARALYVLATTYDPDFFVLGGGIGSDAATAVREALAAMTAASAFGEAVLTGDRILTLPPDADVGTSGAALLGRERSGNASSAPAEERQGGTRP